MPAYLVARVNVTDPEKYEDYKALSPGAIAACGGKFIARGGKTHTLEGDEETRRMVIVEFPDFEAAKACYDSELYRQAREARRGAAEAQFVIVDGI